MTIRRKAHMDAMKDLIEIMALAALLALLSDALWCARDMYVTGFTVGLGLIFFGLSLATTLTAYAVAKYHKTQVNRITKAVLHARLKVCKSKAKSAHRNNLTKKTA